MKIKTYWYGVRDEESYFDGEEFFVEAESKEKADKIANSIFPDGTFIAYFGPVSDYTAECLGLDTY